MNIILSDLFEDIPVNNLISLQLILLIIKKTHRHCWIMHGIADENGEYFFESLSSITWDISMEIRKCSNGLCDGCDIKMIEDWQQTKWL